MEIFITAILMLFAALHAQYDAKKILAGIYIKYPPRWIIRGIVIGSLSYFTVIYWRGLDWIAFGTFSIYLASVFWFVFDVILNLKRDLDPFYMGKRNIIDRTLRGVGSYRILQIKVGLLITVSITHLLYLDYLYSQ